MKEYINYCAIVLMFYFYRILKWIILALIFTIVIIAWNLYGDDHIVYPPTSPTKINSDYIRGIIDSANIVDSTSEFTCNKNVVTDRTVDDIEDEINKSEELSNQPPAFAVLNAYRNLVCLKH